MAQSSFLKEEASKALDASRKKNVQKREIEAQRKDAFLERYTERAADAVQALEIEVQEAHQMAERISNLPTPQDENELLKMIRECEKNLNKKITKSATATKLEGLGGDEQELPDDIDFEQPSKIIHRAWEDRFKTLSLIAHDDYRDHEKIQKTIQRIRLNNIWRKIKWGVIFVGSFIALIVFLVIIGTCSDKQQQNLEAELSELIEAQEYDRAASFIEQNDMDDQYFEDLVDKMINNQQYQEGLRIASEHKLGWFFIQPRMENIAKEYLKTHSKKQTIKYIDELIPLSTDKYKGLTDTTKDNLKLK